ncbi:hypothetical protein BC629DRAFT_140577 [Irpex lacteus]|nr:hypothetical protein BC629DRAFT_140577 [Irpex lacteus]
MWPVTLEQWDARLHWIQGRAQRWEQGLTLWAGEVVELGTNARIPSIVPSALYTLITELSIGKIESRRATYKMRSFQGENYPDTTAERTDALLKSLSPRHIVDLMVGRDRLESISNTLLLVVLPLATCYNRGCYVDRRLSQSGNPDGNGDEPQQTPCAPAITSWWEQRSPRQGTSYFDPLNRLSHLGQEARNTFDDSICGRCLNAIKMACDDLREWMWDELPFLFALKARAPGVTYGYGACLTRHFTHVS